MKSIDIHEDVLAAIKIPGKDVEKVLKLKLARKLAEMSKWEFVEELGKRKVERHYTEKELEEDLAFAKSSK
jgi:predicted HTH domain antitoxin